MACYHPRTAWFGKYCHPSGSPKLVFVPEKAADSKDWFTVPCRGCIGCRTESAVSKALQGAHEAMLHPENIFLTLTYDDLNLPWGGGLCRADLQKFMKRLRIWIDRHFDGRKIRVMYCGEYGDQFGRPHYHVLLFNFDFPDKEFWTNRDGIDVFTSEVCSELWPHGLHEFGEAGFESAGYIGRYINKKINGPLAEAVDPDSGLKHYERIDCRTGEIIEVAPEFYGASSHGGGIGAGWFEKYSSDCFPKDFITVNGKKFPVPNYYLRLLEREEPEMFAEVKAVRVENAPTHEDIETGEFSSFRLAVKEVCHKARLSRLGSRNVGGNV